MKVNMNYQTKNSKNIYSMRMTFRILFKVLNLRLLVSILIHEIEVLISNNTDLKTNEQINGHWV